MAGPRGVRDVRDNLRLAGAAAARDRAVETSPNTGGERGIRQVGAFFSFFFLVFLSFCFFFFLCLPLTPATDPGGERGVRR